MAIRVKSLVIFECTYIHTNAYTHAYTHPGMHLHACMHASVGREEDWEEGKEDVGMQGFYLNDSCFLFISFNNIIVVCENPAEKREVSRSFR